MESIKKIIALISSIIIAAVNYLGINAEPINASDENMKAAFELISDTHVDYKELVIQNLVKLGLRDITKAECEINGIVVAGDITNYGDPESLDTFFGFMDNYAEPERIVPAPGNHDIGHAEDRGLTNEEGRQNFIKKYSDFSGNKIENIYYSTEIDGYTFIVLSDESEDNWDALEISENQMKFLDDELKKNSSSDKPTFVVCHWPLYDTNHIYDIYDGTMEIPDSEKVHNIMKKYDNVIYVSGHAHVGINGGFVNETYGVKYCEIVDGVTYINLPTFGLVNRYGIPWPCTGVHMEIYENKIVLRPRNYLRGSWYAQRNVVIDFPVK